MNRNTLNSNVVLLQDTWGWKRDVCLRSNCTPGVASAIVDVGLRQKLPKPRDIAKIVVFGGFNLNPVIPKSISSISKLVKWLTNSTKVSTILTCTCASIPSISPVQSQLIPTTVCTSSSNCPTVSVIKSTKKCFSFLKMTQTMTNGEWIQNQFPVGHRK